MLAKTQRGCKGSVLEAAADLDVEKIADSEKATCPGVSV